MMATHIQKKIKIGIAEDNVALRKIIVEILKNSEKCEVVFELSNGRGIVADICRTEADIVLLDLGMPEVDGFQALQEIRAQFPSQKVIIFSSLYTKSLGLKMFKGRIQDYLPKNVSIHELISSIQKVNDG